MKSILRLRSFLHPYRWRLLILVTLMLVITASRLVVPEIIRNVIDVGLVEGEMSYLLQAGLVIIAIGLLRAGLDFNQRYRNTPYIFTLDELPDTHIEATA